MIYARSWDGNSTGPSKTRGSSIPRMPPQACVKSGEEVPRFLSSATSDSMAATPIKAPGGIGSGNCVGQTRVRSRVERSTLDRSRRNSRRADARLGVAAVVGLLLMLAWAATGIVLFAALPILLAAGAALLTVISTARMRRSEISKDGGHCTNTLRKRGARSAYDGLANCGCDASERESSASPRIN